MSRMTWWKLGAGSFAVGAFEIARGDARSTDRRKRWTSANLNCLQRRLPRVNALKAHQTQHSSRPRNLSFASLVHSSPPSTRNHRREEGYRVD